MIMDQEYFGWSSLYEDPERNCFASRLAHNILSLQPLLGVVGLFMDGMDGGTHRIPGFSLSSSLYLEAYQVALG